MFSDFTPLLKNKNFVLLWSSQILSQLTIHTLNFILLIRLFEETGSSVATSFLWIAYALPAILIGPIAAALIDVFNKKTILVITNIAQAIIISLFAVYSYSTYHTLYTVALLYSLVNQFYYPTEMASLPGIVRSRLYAHANGMFFVTQQTALIFGFGAAGPVLAAFGFTTTLYICAVFLILASIAVLLLPSMPSTKRTRKSLEDEIVIFFKGIFEGYKFIKGNRNILVPMLILILLQVTLAVVVVNTPTFARDIIKINLTLAGLFLVVPAGLGALTGALLLPKLLSKGIRKIKVIRYSLLIAAISFVLMGSIVEYMVDIYRMVTVIASGYFVGLSFVGMMIPAQTYLQERTPGGFRGRVFGNFWFLVTIATLLPVLASGILVEAFGIRVLAVFLGVISFSTFIFMKKYAAGFIQNGFRR
jgi:MFS family permease